MQIKYIIYLMMNNKSMSHSTHKIETCSGSLMTEN